MSIRFKDIIAETVSIWRSQRELLLPIAGVFLFLPTLATQLFVPVPALTDGSREQAAAVLAAWFVAQAPALIGQAVVISYGAAILFTLLLGQERLPVGAAMQRSLRVLPGLLAVWTITLLLMSIGTMLLFMVAFYIGGRLLVAGPVAVAESHRGPIGALTESVKRSHRRGWLLTSVAMVTIVVGYIAALFFQSFAVAVMSVSGGRELLALPFQALSAGASAAGSLALILLQVAVYRLTKQGI